MAKYIALFGLLIALSGCTSVANLVLLPFNAVANQPEQGIPQPTVWR